MDAGLYASRIPNHLDNLIGFLRLFRGREMINALLSEVP